MVDWVRDRSDDPLRTVIGLGVVAVALLGLPIVQDDRGWLGFVLAVIMGMVRQVLSGVRLGRQHGVTFAFLGVPRIFDVADVYAVELLRPARLTYLRLWLNGRDRPWPVVGAQYWRRPGEPRALAVSLTTGLNGRGGGAGSYDAINDEWVIAPPQVGDGSAEH